jgi:hypothetical protein
VDHARPSGEYPRLAIWMFRGAGPNPPPQEWNYGRAVAKPSGHAPLRELRLADVVPEIDSNLQVKDHVGMEDVRRHANVRRTEVHVS